MNPSQAPTRSIALRVLGRNGSPIRISAAHNWHGSVEWRQERTAKVDVEIRIRSAWKERQPVELELNFQPRASSSPALWPAQGSLAGALHSLAQGIFVPATTPGAISVDVMDYFPYLQGLTIRERHVFVPNVERRLVQSFRSAAAKWHESGKLKFLSLHLCIPPDAGMAEAVDVLAPVAETIAPSGQLVWAVTQHDGTLAGNTGLITAILGY